jgi:hypothetical protein
VPSKIVLKYWNGRGLMEVNRRAISAMSSASD